MGIFKFRNYWDKWFGGHRGKFHREARKQIKESTLQILQQRGRHDWVTIEEIFEERIEPTDLFNSDAGKMFFAEQGIKSRINSAAHSLRKEGHPIIAGMQSWKGKIIGYKGRGYMYASWDCDDVVRVWDEKFSSTEIRERNVANERKTDVILINVVIKKLRENGKEEKARELEKVLEKYEEKLKNKEEEE